MGPPGYAVSVDWSCVSESVSGVPAWCDARHLAWLHRLRPRADHPTTRQSEPSAVQGEMAMLERDSETALYLYTKAGWKKIIQVLF